MKQKLCISVYENCSDQGVWHFAHLYTNVCMSNSNQKDGYFFFYIVILNFKSSRNEIFDYRGVLTLDERNPMVKFRPLGDH